MQTIAPQEQQLTTLSRIRRVRGQPGDPYELIFLDQHDQILIPLTEWYRLRKEQGPVSTRNTYLACLLPYFTFLVEDGCPWNAPPERLRQALRSEEHTSELQSLAYLVCRLLLEKKKNKLD